MLRHLMDLMLIPIDFLYSHLNSAFIEYVAVFIYKNLFIVYRFVNFYFMFFSKNFSLCG